MSGATELAETPLIRELLARCTFPVNALDAAPEQLECAVSGGADSSALLVLAVASGAAVTAHHVDHGFRPNSAAEADTVAALAERFGAQFASHRVEVEHGPNLEARARAARYSVLPTSVATGHTLDDRAETILINLVRGAARSGLTPLRDPHRHPISALRRSETVQLCAELEIEAVQDVTNSDPAYQRNRMRHEALPLLDAIASRDVAAVLDRQAAVLALEDDLLDELAAEIDVVDALALSAAHPALARRAVRAWILENWGCEHPPSVASVDRVLDVAAGKVRSTQIAGGYHVLRRAQRLRIEPPSR